MTQEKMKELLSRKPKNVVCDIDNYVDILLDDCSVYVSNPPKPQKLSIFDRVKIMVYGDWSRVGKHNV